jgi:TolB-like protein/DNA-binding SARP family transcriptional activator
MRDGEEVERHFRNRLGLALLVFLAVERSVPTDVVTRLFWPDRTTTTARRTLRRMITGLNSWLRGDCIESSDERLRVPPGVRTDAEEFEQLVSQGALVEALELYAGGFLETFPPFASSLPLESWRDCRRARLSDLHRSARRQLLDRSVELGETDAAIQIAREWVNIEPLDDEAQVRLIGLLAGSGHRAEALREYAQYERLVRGAGLEPLAELRALIGGAQAEIPNPKPVRTRRRASTAGPAPFVGEVEPGDSLGTLGSRFGRLIAELKKRRVFRVLIAYCIAGAMLLEVAGNLDEALKLPESTTTVVAVLLLLGLPIAVALAWAFDITAGGVRHVGSSGASFRRVGRVTSSRYYAPVALVLLLTTAGFLVWRSAAVIRSEPSSAAADPTPLPTRIAVLYFDDHTEGRAAVHVADGLAEALIHRLSNVPGLDVLSRYAVRQYRDRDVPNDSVMVQLGVGTIIQGSVLRSGDRLRVTVQLIDARSGSHLYSHAMDRPWGDVLTLLDELAEEVSRGLRLELGQQVQLRQIRAGTATSEAWELVLRAEAARKEGERLLLTGEDRAARREIQRADSLVSAAERADPDWVEPPILRGWLAMEDANAMRLEQPHAIAARLYEGLAHAEHALRMDGGDAGALEIAGRLRARIADYDPAEAGTLRERAERELRAAVDAETKRPLAWSGLGELLWRRGAFTEARYMAEKAQEVDSFLSGGPESQLFNLIQIDLDLEHFESATEACENGRLWFPHDRRFDSCALSLLSWTDIEEPDPARAWRLAGELAAKTPPASRELNAMLGSLQVAAVLARAGIPDSARAVIRRVRSNPPVEDPRLGLKTYELYARVWLGDVDEALNLLELILDAAPGRREYLARDWALRPLSGHPRFVALLAPGGGS